MRTLADPADRHYAPFWDITVDALRHAAARLGLADALSRTAEKRLMDEYACLSAFPDVIPALRSLRERFDLPLAIFSNGSPPMLAIAVRSAGMAGLFNHVLSVDAVRAYKPAPAAYKLGTRAFGATAREIAFVSANGWNVAGAAWFGYATFWINRAGRPLEQLGVEPRVTGCSMTALVAAIENARQRT